MTKKPPKDFSRGERQKEVVDSYRKEWADIFKKKVKKVGLAGQDGLK